MSKYSDIISDGGMDPRNAYEEERRALNKEIEDDNAELDVAWAKVVELEEKCSKFASELYKTRGQRNEAVKALKHLVIVAQKDEINKDHLDQALRKARNVITDIDPTVERCDCCY